MQGDGFVEEKMLVLTENQTDDPNVLALILPYLLRNYSTATALYALMVSSFRPTVTPALAMPNQGIRIPAHLLLEFV